jgi:RNA-directed DNA polymerase
MGKLGAATGDPTAVMADLGVLDDAVNGPEDLPDWDAIAWRRQEEQVRRLRQRIFKAAQAEDWRRWSQPVEAIELARRSVKTSAGVR